jgi:hypothetical protein
MSNVNMAAKSILMECLEGIALDIIQAKEWLSKVDNLSVETYIRITWRIIKYGNEFDLDELEKNVHSLYKEMMTAREPYEGIEWECLSITMLAGFLAGFWSEDSEDDE